MALITVITSQLKKQQKTQGASRVSKKILRNTYSYYYQYKKKIKTTRIIYKIKFINSVRVVAGSLINLANNYSKGLQKCIWGNLGLMLTEIKTCLDFNKNYEKDFDKDVTKRIQNIY